MGRRRVKMTNKPSYRFAGYNDTWKEMRFGEVVKRSSKSIGNPDLPIVEYEDVISGEGRLNKNIFQKLSNKKGLYFSEGDVLFGKLRPYLQNWLLPKFTGLAVGDWWVLQSSELDSKFLYTYIQTQKYQAVSNLSTGTKMPRSDWNTVSDSILHFPTLLEQKTIGSFFQELDQLISLQQRKLEVLKEQKETYLNLLFPTKGQKKPALRFAGFEDEWSNAMLGDIAELYQPQTISSKELLTEGFPVFGANGYIGYYKDYNHKEDQVTISARGEGTGTPSFVEGPVWITGNSMVVNVEHQENIIKSFLYAFCLSFDFKPFVTGGAQPQLTREILKKVNIMLPTLSEQKVIGSFFQDLDKAIAKQEEKVNQLKESKQTLLRKMFI